MKSLDSRKQRGLFEEGPPRAAPAPRPVPKGTVQFEAPDPLRIRALLATLSFCDIEQDYRPGGRPPYSLRALVG